MLGENNNSMMACPLEEQLAAYLAGALAAADTEQIHNHVEGCDKCRQWFEEARANDVVLDSVRRAMAGSGRSKDLGQAAAVEASGQPGPPSSSHPIIPGYDIIREIHRGGQGVVYEALQRSTNRPVAIKAILAGAFAGEHSKMRFEREIKLVASLKHPNIIIIHDSGITHGQYYFVMDLVRGRHLDDYVREVGCSPGQILLLFKHIISAVAYAHRRGIIHRDLKPSNILVDQDDVPHVLDFGLAKVTGEAVRRTPAMAVSISGQVLGTVRYMSPEQAAGAIDSLDARSDVYSLGVIMYELLTGHSPYETAIEPAAALRNIRGTVPQRPTKWNPRIPAPIEAILLKSLAKPPQQRYESAVELERVIADWLNSPDKPLGPGISDRELVRGRPSLRIVAFFIVIAFSVTLVFFFIRSDRLPVSSTPAPTPTASLGGVPPTTKGIDVNVPSVTPPRQDGESNNLTKQSQIRELIPLGALEVTAMSVGGAVRVNGAVLNDSELRTLHNRLASFGNLVVLEVRANPERVRLLTEQTLMRAGAKDARVRLLGKDGEEGLHIELTQGGAVSASVAVQITQQFVFDKAYVHCRGF